MNWWSVTWIIAMIIQQMTPPPAYAIEQAILPIMRPSFFFTKHLRSKRKAKAGRRDAKAIIPGLKLAWWLIWFASRLRSLPKGIPSFVPAFCCLAHANDVEKWRRAALSSSSLLKFSIRLAECWHIWGFHLDWYDGFLTKKCCGKNVVWWKCVAIKNNCKKR